MNAFAKRRAVNTGVTALAILLGALALQILHTAIRPIAFWSGWVLFAVILSLSLFNARKKLPFLPIGNASTWLQFHIYAGLFSIVAFFAHAGFALPTGRLESLLFLLFAGIAISGLFGTAISRVIPVGLTSKGEAVLYERIPALREALRREVEDIVVESARAHQKTTISDFHREQLAPYFRGPRNFIYHAMGWSRPLRELERELGVLDRYLNDDEREALREITERVRAKDDLDYQWARQLLLKAWLFIHIPLTFSLLILIGIHIFVVYGFRGNLP